MPRTEVYQLRLTKSEKDELASRAKLQGVSIAKLIRERLKLDAPFVPEPRGVSDEFLDLVFKHRLRMPMKTAERLARKELGENFP